MKLRRDTAAIRTKQNAQEFLVCLLQSLRYEHNKNLSPEDVATLEKRLDRRISKALEAIENEARLQSVALPKTTNGRTFPAIRPGLDSV